MNAITILFRVFGAIVCVIAIPCAMLGWLCCYDPNQPGMYCDHPNVAALMVFIIFASIAGLCAICTAKTKTRNSKL